LSEDKISNAEMTAELNGEFGRNEERDAERATSHDEAALELIRGNVFRAFFLLKIMK